MNATQQNHIHEILLCSCRLTDLFDSPTGRVATVQHPTLMRDYDLLIQRILINVLAIEEAEA